MLISLELQKIEIEKNINKSLDGTQGSANTGEGPKFRALKAQILSLEKKCDSIELIIKNLESE